MSHYAKSSNGSAPSTVDWDQIETGITVDEPEPNPAPPSEFQIACENMAAAKRSITTLRRIGHAYSLDPVLIAEHVSTIEFETLRNLSCLIRKRV
jgi:hypothetical protein